MTTKTSKSHPFIEEITKHVEDAFDLLDEHGDDIANMLDDDANEALDDVESALAEARGGLRRIRRYLKKKPSGKGKDEEE